MTRRNRPSLDTLQNKPLGLAWRYVRARPWPHALLFAAITAAVGCGTASQYAIKHLVDTVSAHASAAVWWAYGLMIALIVADNVFWRVSGWLATKVFVRVAADARNELFRYVTGHAPDYFIDRQPGSISGRVSSASSSIFTLENTFAWQILPPSISVLGAIVVVFTVNLTMGLALVSVAVLLSIAFYFLARRGARHHIAYAKAAAQLDGELVDVVANMNVVRIFGATLFERRRFGARVSAERDARQDSLMYLENLRTVHSVAIALLASGMLGWVLWLWQKGLASPGDIVLVSSLGFAVLHGTRDLAVSLVDLSQHLARLAESASSLLEPHGLPDRPGALDLQVPQGCGIAVDMEEVVFAYPGREPVLNGLTLNIAAGERVGLVGSSGAGKSTVLALLQRLYDVRGGRILVGGMDVRDMTQHSLRRAIGVVPQDISLFHRTLLENIRYGRPDASEAETMAAAEAAGCRDFIEALPEGFDTIVGDRGVKLSGGQRQRIAIARAFLKDAPALLLDEATSALDSASEHLIQEALARLMRNRTVIAVAHRLSTLKQFDRIVVMDKGRIIDMGSPLELENRPGPYRDLLQYQRSAANA